MTLMVAKPAVSPEHTHRQETTPMQQARHRN